MVDFIDVHCRANYSIRPENEGETKADVKRILGIDPGYDRCGFGVIEGAKALAYGAITTPKGEIAERLREIAADLRGIIEKHNPDALVIEDLFFSKSVTTAMKVAMVRGVVMLLAAEAGLRVLEVKPNEVKMALTGYGRADKKQMQEMVKVVFKLKAIPKPDDAADALAIAWCGANRV